ncbi:PSPA7_2676 family Cys-rich small protein [Metapseudomonas otitidis]|uniref:PSPA7_2676 family Cys-rich small protein n=1 Tax=Metapseudomonas otitidis TaxID=319939 RepID=UPI00280AC027|nr:PSPA7_2676 family Cys-rich small protein [Pseudomonas otitidis]
MRLHCFLLGCVWTDGYETEVGAEPMLCQRCQRCGSHRYVKRADPPHLATVAGAEPARRTT